MGFCISLSVPSVVTGSPKKNLSNALKSSPRVSLKPDNIFPIVVVSKLFFFPDSSEVSFPFIACGRATDMDKDSITLPGERTLTVISYSP